MDHLVMADAEDSDGIIRAAFREKAEELFGSSLHSVTNRESVLRKHGEYNRDLTKAAISNLHITNDGELAGDAVWAEDDVLVLLSRGVNSFEPDVVSIHWKILGDSYEKVQAKHDQLTEAYPPNTEEKVATDVVKVNFWWRGPHGAQNITRKLETPEWDEIKDNYVESVRDGVEVLLDPEFRPESGGQLLLWHGEPGLGKTYTIRSLIRHWRGWSNVEYVTDAESFFGDASYMMNVCLREDDAILYEDEDVEEKEGERWKLIVLEDAGKYIAEDSYNEAGMSRLLNLTEGLIGQGLNILLLITTNEPIRKLNQAIVRPGRCLSQIEFRPFDVEESNEWLASRGVEDAVDRPKTLAELYDLYDPRQVKKVKERMSIGFV